MTISIPKPDQLKTLATVSAKTAKRPVYWKSEKKNILQDGQNTYYFLASQRFY